MREGPGGEGGSGRAGAHVPEQGCSGGTVHMPPRQGDPTVTLRQGPATPETVSDRGPRETKTKEQDRLRQKSKTD